MPIYPDLHDVEKHATQMKQLLRDSGLHARTISGIQTKAYRTGRKTTGLHATNRESRWTLNPSHPQYGAEHDCKAIFVKLCAQIFCFDNAPQIKDAAFRKILEDKYLGHVIEPGRFRDRLLLEHFDFNKLVAEGHKPTHGHSEFHIGHEDPTLTPKHAADNVSWRSYRSNLIQGNMTLREARVYFIKLIGRYFELGEIEVASK